MKYESKIDLLNKNNSDTLVYDLVQEFSVGIPLKVLNVNYSSIHLGAALCKNGHAVWGIETSHAATKIAGSILNNVFEGTIQNFFQQFPEERFNIIVLNDVLERAADPLEVLLLCKLHLEKQGGIIASVYNVAHIAIRAMLVEGRWDYTAKGILDRTHLRFFTRTSLIKLFSDSAYQLLRLHPVRLPVAQVEEMCQFNLEATMLLATENITKDDQQFDFQYVLLAKPVADVKTATENNSAISNAIGVRVVCLLITDINSVLVELRLRLPLDRWAMQNNGYVRFVSIFQYTIEDIKWGDVFVFHREASGKYGLDLINFLRLHGKKVVFEIDDLLTDLPIFLLNYANSVASKKYLIGSLQNADAITVTTNRLGDAISVYNKNIHCVPNCSENLFNHVAKHEQIQAQEVTLIIASSDSVLVHFIVQALKLAQEKFFVQILVIGPLGEYLENAGLHIKRATNMRYYDFKEFVASIDNGIGLIPLDDSLFSSCKSPIKYFDYSLAGIPSICSNVPPYADYIVNGKNGFLVENTVESWFSAIELLVLNHALRTEISESAAHYVHHNYNWETAANAWQTLIASMSQDIFSQRTANKTINFAPLIRQRLLSRIINTLLLPIAYKRAFQIIKKSGIKGLMSKIQHSLKIH